MHVNPARPVVKVRVYSETFGVMLNVDVPLGPVRRAAAPDGRHGPRRAAANAALRPGLRHLRRGDGRHVMNSDSIHDDHGTDTTERAKRSTGSTPRCAGLRYGTVTAVVQDGVVVQVERTEKFRLSGQAARRPGIAGRAARRSSDRVQARSLKAHRRGRPDHGRPRRRQRRDPTGRPEERDAQMEEHRMFIRSRHRRRLVEPRPHRALARAAGRGA